MRELREVLFFVLKEKRDVLLSIFFGFLAGLASVALLASSGYLISRAALTSNLTILIILGACLKLFSLTSALSRYGERLFSHRATFSMLSSLRLSFFEKIVPQAPGIYRKYRSGDLLARIIGDVESLQNFLLRVFYPPVVLAAVFLATIFFTSFYSAQLAWILVAGMVLVIFLIPVLFAWRMHRIDIDVRIARSSLSTDATEFLYGFRELKIHREMDRRQEQLRTLALDYGERQRKAGLERNFNQSISGLAGLLVCLAVLAVGAALADAGELDAIFLAMLAMITIGLFENAPQLAALPSFLEESRQAAVRLDSVTGGGERTGHLEAAPLAKEVVFEDVSFRYPQEARDALKNISLTIPAGGKTAIVGPSGSGKSTVMALLLKVLEPSSGKILLDGQALADTEEESWWNQVAPVLQENHFFYGTLRSNLLIAREDATEEELHFALAQVELSHFPLSKNITEKGGNLSGGEKQRLAIARAILKNRGIWLLDEPVSSVDSVTAHQIYRSLFTANHDDTFVIISHDLSKLEEMDQIIVMDGGTVVEAGTFAALMAKQGYFYKLKQIEKTVFTV